MHPQLSPTDEGSTAHSEDSYEGRNHGHAHNSGARYLDLRLLRTCKQRLDEVLEVCKAQSVRTLRMCMGPWMNHRMMTFFITPVLCIILLLAFRGGHPRAEDPGYELNEDNGRAIEHHQFPIIVSRHHNTVYRTIVVVDNQFHGARPVVHQQAPMAFPSDLELTGQAKRQHVLYLDSETETSSPVSGLYLMPVSITDGDWPQTQQETHPSSSPTTHAQDSQNLQGSQSSENSEPQAEHYHKICARRNLSADQSDADTTSFTRWGVEILYALHRHSRRSLHIYRESCIENACSPQKQLISMCNATKNISDSFQKQECEWCWPENQRKHLEIEKHCTEVSKRAFNAMIIICGIFLFCSAIVAIVLAPRMLHKIGMAKADRIIHENETTNSLLQKENNSISNPPLLRRISKTGRSFDIAKSRIDGKANETCSPGENDGTNPWYKPVFARSKKRSRISSENRGYGRSRLQKQRTKPLDQDIASGNRESHERVPVLPPAPPAISSRVFSENKNMVQGSLLSDAGTNSSQRDTQGVLLRSLKQSRAVSSGSEQNTSEPTHR